MQELLEVLGIPYTGSRVHACMRCADKVLTKLALRDAGLPTPDWVSLGEIALGELGAADALAAIEERLAFPLVVKPASQGSSLGVAFARTPDEVPAALIAASSYGRKVILERFVAGRELAVAVAPSAQRGAPDRRGGTPRARVLRLRGPLRDRPHGVRLPGGARGGRHRERRRDRARAWRLLGCRGFARVDMILGATARPSSRST